MNTRLVAGIAIVFTALAIVAGVAGSNLLKGSTEPIQTAPTTSITPVWQSDPPQPGDFEVDVIVTSKQCFGPASCVYTYNIDPWQPGSFYLPQPRAFTVIYTVIGGDQNAVGNFTVDTTGAVTFNNNVTALGPDGATFRAVVTQVTLGNWE